MGRPPGLGILLCWCLECSSDGRVCNMVDGWCKGGNIYVVYFPICYCNSYG